jgi:mRNA interferase YafQ
MYKIVATNQFKKDYKLCLKRGLKEAKLVEVLTILESNGKLPTKHKPHLLKGNFKGFWECHIQPDWLLIWEQAEEIKLITLNRTGTHSDLFK